MADLIDITVGFDLANKGSTFDGNYQMETVSDNPSKAVDSIGPTDMYGDAFTVNDADALTFKLQDHTLFLAQGGLSNVITGGVLRITGADLANRYNGRELKESVSDIFKVEAELDSFQINDTLAYLVVAESSNTYCYVRAIFNQKLRAIIVSGGVTESVVVTGAVISNGDDVGLRCSRDGSNNILLEYRLNQGSWITITSKASSGFTGTAVVDVLNQSATNNTVDFNYISVNEGTLDGNPVRPSTATIFSKNNDNEDLDAESDVLATSTMDYVDFSANAYLSSLVYKLSGVEKARKTFASGDLTGSGTVVISVPTTGSFGDVTGVYTVTATFVSDGIERPSITRLLNAYSSGLKFDKIIGGRPSSGRTIIGAGK